MPLDLDYPEILGLRAPKPTLVLNDEEDTLFSLPEMKRADRMLAELGVTLAYPGITSGVPAAISAEKS